MHIDKKAFHDPWKLESTQGTKGSSSHFKESEGFMDLPSHSGIEDSKKTLFLPENRKKMMELTEKLGLDSKNVSWQFPWILYDAKSCKEASELVRIVLISGVNAKEKR